MSCSTGEKQLVRAASHVFAAGVRHQEGTPRSTDLVSLLRWTRSHAMRRCGNARYEKRGRAIRPRYRWAPNTGCLRASADRHASASRHAPPRARRFAHGTPRSRCPDISDERRGSQPSPASRHRSRLRIRYRTDVSAARIPSRALLHPSRPRACRVLAGTVAPRRPCAA